MAQHQILWENASAFQRATGYVQAVYDITVAGIENSARESVRDRRIEMPPRLTLMEVVRELTEHVTAVEGYFEEIRECMRMSDESLTEGDWRAFAESLNFLARAIEGAAEHRNGWMSEVPDIEDIWPESLYTRMLDAVDFLRDIVETIALGLSDDFHRTINGIRTESGLRVG